MKAAKAYELTSSLNANDTQSVVRSINHTGIAVGRTTKSIIKVAAVIIVVGGSGSIRGLGEQQEEREAA